jgi:hypothetical protein
MPYFAGGFAANVGQRVSPVRAKGGLSPRSEFKNRGKMHRPVMIFDTFLA